MALFGEKYGDIVRVVQVSDYSIELCGGCHVQNTAEIGLFKIVSETGIGAGTRRIEAVTGKKAYELLNEKLQLLETSASLLNTRNEEVPKKIEALQQDYRLLQKENESLLQKLSNIEAKNVTSQKKTVNGIDVLATKVDAKNMNALRTMLDEMKQSLQSGIIVLASVNDGKVQLVAGVTDDLIEKGFHADKLIKEIASEVDGSGGGRPHMAQAGGKNPDKLQDALLKVEDWVKSIS